MKLQGELSRAVRTRPLQVAVLALGLLAFEACSSQPSSHQTFEGPPDAGDAGGGDTTTANDDGGPASDAEGNGDAQSFSTATIASIAIQPQNATIVVVNGVAPAPMSFQVMGTTTAGAQVQLDTVAWTYDRFDLGSVDASGNFTATGFVGGVGNLTAMAQGLSATTTITVQLQMTYDPNGLAPTLGPTFAAATLADPLLAFDYPYDQTVFPRGLPAPVPQWCLGVAPACTGNATDVYDIKITSPTATFEAFTTTGTPSAPSFSFPTLPVDVWNKLTDSTTGAMTFSIARYDGTNAYTPVTLTWTVAAADLAGTIYYWEINNGTVVKMPLGSSPGTFLQIPTASPAIGCVACHSVSKDGSTLVAAFNGSASPWGTFDTQTGSSIFVSGSDPNNGPAGSGFEAISPDGSWVLWGQEQGAAYLSLNPSNSSALAAQLSPGMGNPVQPAWSPDGNHIAFGVRADGNWLDYQTSSLWITDVNVSASPPTFANTAQLITNTATRPTVIYPSFSPDSSWIAFERSTQARSRGAQAELWLTSLDGQTVQSLDAANAGTGLYAQNNANYEPTFMPVAVGGYFWLVFVSERVYGNTLTDTTEGTSSAPGRHKQLWVTAIDAQPQPGVDPSHPAFWLPGQDTNDQNMRGEWALDPCLQQGASCTAGYQCCAGFCRSDDAGTPVCTMPTGGCSATGEACTTAASCCAVGASCIGGFCNVAPN